MDSDIAASFRARLLDYGLEITSPYTQRAVSGLEPGIPEQAELIHPYGRHTVTLIHVPTPTMKGMGAIDPSILESGCALVLGRRINARTADTYRRLGVNYLDEAGNAYIDFDGIHIDVRGRRDEGDSKRSEVGRAQATNLFSTKRSQIIFALLAWPDLAGAPVRTIADASGVSVGQVQETLGILSEVGFLSTLPNRRLRRGRELLEQWAAAYPTGLGNPARARAFHGDIDNLQLRADVALAVSGESAVRDQIRPETLTIYADALPPQLIAVNRWRTDRRPNIFVRSMFWTDPDHGRVFGEASRAPAPLVYADLLASSDGRQIEIARSLRESDDRLKRL